MRASVVVLIAAFGAGCAVRDFRELERREEPAQREASAPPATGADAAQPPDAAEDFDASSPQADAQEAGALPSRDAAADSGSPLAGDTGAAPEQDAGMAGPPPCPAPLARCGDACVDTRSDARHCGRCDFPCDPGDECDATRCESTAGCSDRTREAFADPLRYPTIAGCAASWLLASMRDARSGGACGRSLQTTCEVPADACALGWHVCGNAATGPADLTARIGEEDCLAQSGRWAGALGDFTCSDCTTGNGAGAVCCGDDCVQQNGNCLWPGRTAWFGVVDGVLNACGSTEQPFDSFEIGVMCCRDAS